MKIKKRLMEIVLVVGMATLLLANTGFTQESKQPLQFTIKSDKQVYEIGEEIVVEAIFENRSDKEVILFLCKESPICHLIPMKKISDDSIDLHCEICQILNPKVEITYIRPHNLITKNLKIDLSKWATGKYNFTLIYNFPNIPLDFKHLPNQEIFHQKLFSNTITIEVAEKKSVREGDLCYSDDNCLKIDCSRYDTPVKEGYKPFCVDNKCKCMCYGCE